MKERWLRSSLIEKQMIWLSSFVVGVWVFYCGIWLPLYEQTALLRARVRQAQQTLSWMQGADQEMKKRSQRKVREVTSPVTLLTFLKKQVDQLGLASQITRLTQEANETIVISGQQIEFGRWMTLLMAVAEQEAVAIIQLSMIGEKQSGLVRVNAVLKMAHQAS
jgi:type II secretory pathway component PulM